MWDTFHAFVGPALLRSCMQILDAIQIERKLARIAIEILERHVDHEHVILLGINNNGYETALRLKQGIDAEGYPLEVVVKRIRLSPADPLHGGITFEGDVQELTGQHLIIVDDVANTGRTAFYAAKPLLEILPASVEIAVLIDRQHKTWPVHSDYVGLTLATTLQEDIRVYYDDEPRVELF